MRLAFRSASCNNRMSALLRAKNSMIRDSCSPRLMFQHTTLTELGGQRSHRGLAKLPVSISGTVSISLVYGLSFRGRAPQPTFNSTCISFSFRRNHLCLLFFTQVVATGYYEHHRNETSRIPFQTRVAHRASGKQSPFVLGTFYSARDRSTLFSQLTPVTAGGH